jgi:hypothetical protein
LELIGFDSTAAVTINLIYSTLGMAVFCWYAVAWRTGRRTPRNEDASPDRAVA